MGRAMYLRIDGSQYRQILVAGDIHGCYQLLHQQLQAYQFDPEQDLLLSVGDIIDRGPQSLSCLVLLEAPWFRMALGNHEQMAFTALLSGMEQHWQRNGGDWFSRLRGEARLRAERLLRRCEQLPLVMEVTHLPQRVVIAHADYPAAHYRYEQPVDAEALVWSRDRVSRALEGEGERIGGADLFLFGHTPLKRPLKFLNQLYLDTGAVFGGRLTLLRIKRPEPLPSR